MKKVTVDVSTYNLIYIRRNDGEKCLCKSLSKYEYSILEPVNGSWVERKITQYALRRNYRPNKKVNKLNVNRFQFINYGRTRIA